MYSILLLSFAACSPPEKITSPVSYFDNPGFFEGEITRLKERGQHIRKTIITNTDSTTVPADTVNWDKELELIRSFTLNKSSYGGKFRVDSVNASPLLTVIYTATDQKIPVRYLSVSFHNDTVRSIEALKRDDSPLFDSELRWRYVPDSGYSIRGSQRIKGVKENTFAVTAVFDE